MSTAAVRTMDGRFWLAALAVLAAGMLLLRDELGTHIDRARLRLEAQAEARAARVVGAVAPLLGAAGALQKRDDLAASFQRWREEGDAIAGKSLGSS